jgi:hypothetical protein
MSVIEQGTAVETADLPVSVDSASMPEIPAGENIADALLKAIKVIDYREALAFALALAAPGGVALFTIYKIANKIQQRGKTANSQKTESVK